MSTYSSPPSDPNAYGHPPNGGPDFGHSSGAAPVGGEYASWIARVAASLVDTLLALAVGIIPLGIGAAMSGADDDGTARTGALILLLGYLLMLGVSIWNYVVRQGKTGQTVGKKVLGIRLIKEATGAPVGAGPAFGRIFVHIIDQLPCYVGYLWPLWDSKKQTFTDKLLATVVVKA